MSTDVDWSAFYTAVCAHAGDLLTGIDDEDREVISLVAETDAFWSDGMQDALVTGAAAGDVRAGVLHSLDVWREKVLAVLAADFMIEIDRGAATIDPAGPLIDRLVTAARGAAG